MGRTKWKYKSIAIVFSVLMVYLIFASVMCAVQAASQGGSANSTMLLSVVVTYGCKCHPSCVLDAQPDISYFSVSVCQYPSL
jgi:hypothetical protein